GDAAAKSGATAGPPGGLGRAGAATLGGEGCRLHLAARGGDQIGSRREETLARHKVEIALHPGDLSTTPAMIELARACGDLDVLVNNAGDIPAGTLEALDDAELRRGFDL